MLHAGAIELSCSASYICMFMHVYRCVLTFMLVSFRPMPRTTYHLSIYSFPRIFSTVPMERQNGRIYRMHLCERSDSVSVCRLLAVCSGCFVVHYIKYIFYIVDFVCRSLYTKTNSEHIWYICAQRCSLPYHINNHMHIIPKCIHIAHTTEHKLLKLSERKESEQYAHNLVIFNGN